MPLTRLYKFVMIAHVWTATGCSRLFLLKCFHADIKLYNKVLRIQLPLSFFTIAFFFSSVTIECLFLPHCRSKKYFDSWFLKSKPCCKLVMSTAVFWLMKTLETLINLIERLLTWNRFCNKYIFIYGIGLTVFQ